MDGITFLRKIMSQHPLPVVMCSSLVEAGSETLLQALEAGAVDVIVKPRMGVAEHLVESRIRICDAVKAAASARVAGARRPPASVPHVYHEPERKLTADAVLPPPNARAMARTTETVVCIGASTGGTEALREVLEALPADSPGIVIVQHMPEKFTASFAKRLDSLCAVSVKEAEDGDTVLRG
ncbi:chemotaxis protein CheB, partial [Caulobacter sp. CCH5-E12]